MGVWLASVAAGSRVAAVALFGLARVPAVANGVLVSTLNRRLFPPELLGRVSSLKGTASTATLPVGSLLGGVAATLFGARTAMALGAAGFAVAGVCSCSGPGSADSRPSRTPRRPRST